MQKPIMLLLALRLQQLRCHSPSLYQLPYFFTACWWRAVQPLWLVVICVWSAAAVLAQLHFPVHFCHPSFAYTALTGAATDTAAIAAQLALAAGSAATLTIAAATNSMPTTATNWIAAVTSPTQLTVPPVLLLCTWNCCLCL